MSSALPTRMHGLLSVLLSACVMCMSSTSASASPSKSAANSQSQPAKQKKGSVKIKHHRSSSQESPQERDKRLTRECKGAPNAGGCLGYATP